MVWIERLVVALWVVPALLAVKVKVVLNSEQEDSRHEDDTQESHESMLPFLSRARSQPATTSQPRDIDPIERATVKAKPHPNDLLFPLIYHQPHINGMFKFGANWYTWSVDNRSDGSSGVNYYICYDEPKRCDEVGWERTDTVPKCAFQIDSVLADDRACLNPFGAEPRASSLTPCDGAEQMKVSELIRACGARIRSLWRFVRVGRRPTSAAKPADVNSLICDDEEECYVTIEYRIHHDRITFSLHEPTRGQTFKSVLKRGALVEDVTTDHERRPHPHEPAQKRTRDDERKFHIRLKKKPAEGKGPVKDRTDHHRRNKLVVREESDDTSD